MSTSRSLIARGIAVTALALAVLACGLPGQGGESPAAPSGSSGGAPTESSGAPAESSSGTSGGALDPCAVLSPAEAEAAFGGPASGPGIPNVTGDTVFRCAYESADGQRVSILIRRATSTSQNDGIFAEAKTNAGSNAQPVTGLGDDAYYETSIRQLNIKKGVCWVILSGHVSEGKDLLTTLTGIAPAVLGRLP
jgi:hypothetical protein